MTDVIERLKELCSNQIADPSTAPEFVFLDPDLPVSEWEKQYSMDVVYVRADRIEELVKERDEARHLQSCACNYDTPTDVCMGHHALFERLYGAERAKLEDKLAKAVEVMKSLQEDMLERSRAGMDTIHGEEYRIVNAGRTAWNDFCATLAELEGK